MLHAVDNKRAKNHNKGRKKAKKDESYSKPVTLDKSLSIGLFSNLKSENGGRLGDVDFGHLAPRKNNFLQDSSSNHNIYDPHSAFTSLKSSESNNDNINLGDTQTAFFPATPKPFAADSSVHLKGVPDAPQDLKTLVVKARFVVLSWKPPAKNGDGIHTYTVYYRQENSER